jgi:phosphopantetheinyl transferase
MPIFFQQDIDENTRLAIWKIEEGEEFFLASVPLQRDITHPHKRLQHLAGRYLLKYLYADFPIELIRIADTKKPYLEGEAYHFSISHCGDYAAVIVSSVNRVGVDIEIASDKVARIRHKFVSEGEWKLLFNDLPDAFKHQTSNVQLTLIWSCKEACFKWFGWGQVDFKKHIQVQHIDPVSTNQFKTIVLFKKTESIILYLESHFFDRLCLSYLYT